MGEGVAIKVRNEHGNVTKLVNAYRKPIVYGYDILDGFVSSLE